MPVCGFGDVMGIDTIQNGEESKVISWEKRGSTSYFKQPNRMKRDVCTTFIGLGLFIQFLEATLPNAPASQVTLDVFIDN